MPAGEADCLAWESTDSLGCSSGSSEIASKEPTTDAEGCTRLRARPLDESDVLRTSTPVSPRSKSGIGGNGPEVSRDRARVIGDAAPSEGVLRPAVATESVATRRIAGEFTTAVDCGPADNRVAGDCGGITLALAATLGEAAARARGDADARTEPATETGLRAALCLGDALAPRRRDGFSAGEAVADGLTASALPLDALL